MPPSFLTVSNRTKGFTIGEVVLSSFVMTLGIVSVLGLITFSFQSSVESQNLIVASELAQEGVELVRNIRDNALVDKIATGSPTDVFSVGNWPAGVNSRCIIDYNDVALSCGDPNPQLVLTGGFYGHSAGAGRFYRLLKIDHTGGSDTARVKSFVTWQNPESNLNGVGGDTAWCTIANKCTYTEVFLTEWK